MPIIKGVTIINHSWLSRGSKHPFIILPYCEKFKKADPKSLSVKTHAQIRNRQSFEKKAFLNIQPLIKKTIFQTNLERVPLPRPWVPIIKGVTIINHSWLSRGSKHPSFVTHPYGEELTKADLKSLIFKAPLQIRNRLNIQTKAFLIQPLLKNIFQTNLERVPLPRPWVPIIKGVTIINHSWLSRGSKHPFIILPYCEKFKKADPKSLSVKTHAQIRNRQSFKK